MKWLTYLLASIILWTSCKSGKDGDIEYVNAYNLQINGLHKKKASVSSLLAFKNTFAASDYKLKDVNLDILVDGIDVGTYYSKSTLSIKAQSELKVPMEYTFDSDKLAVSEGESSFVVELKGDVSFTNAQGEDIVVKISHKETVHPIIPKKERKSNKVSEEEGLSNSELRKLKRELKKEKKLLKDA